MTVLIRFYTQMNFVLVYTCVVVELKKPMQSSNAHILKPYYLSRWFFKLFTEDLVADTTSCGVRSTH
jgi:hypothetical protein